MPTVLSEPLSAGELHTRQWLNTIMCLIFRTALLLKSIFHLFLKSAWSSAGAFILVSCFSLNVCILTLSVLRAEDQNMQQGKDFSARGSVVAGISLQGVFKR